jgi:hypothetical protein
LIRRGHTIAKRFDVPVRHVEAVRSVEPAI